MIAFIKSVDGVPTDINKFTQFNQVNEPATIKVGAGAEEYVSVGENAFPKEYSVSGWFKWDGPYTADWHLVFRLTNNKREENTDY